ncbi:MAG: hypothetical protein Q6L50_06400 [Gloeomargarita sp. GMQP_bins_120]
MAGIPGGLFNDGGSTTFAPLRSDRINHPQFRLRSVEPPGGKPGSGAGIERLINGQLVIAQSSRPFKDKEFQRAQIRGCRLLEQMPIALGKDSRADSGPSARYFHGQGDQWATGGRSQSAGAALESQSARRWTPCPRNSGRLLLGVGYATVSQVNQSMVCIVPIAKEAGSPYVTSDINGQKVNLAVISNGTYPITRHLFVIIRWDGTLDEKANVAYANLFLSDEGQQLVQAAGFASLR